MIKGHGKSLASIVQAVLAGQQDIASQYLTPRDNQS